MVLRNPSGYPYKRFADKGLECFLKHCFEVRNMACRYYSGVVEKEPNATTLDIALSNLKNFLFIIQFDHFQEEVSNFCSEYNIPMSSITHERKSNYAPCDQSNHALISKYNKFDVEMFNRWKELSVSH